MTTLELITRLGACDDALAWARSYPDPQEAWSSCPRGDWMAWWLGRLAELAGDGSPEHRRAVLIACRCARTAPRLPDPSARNLDLIEAWARGGEDRRAEVRWPAADPAYADAYAAYYAAARAARAAAYAYATATAYAAAYAADDAAADAAWEAHLAALADLIRDAVPVVPLPGGNP